MAKLVLEDDEAYQLIIDEDNEDYYPVTEAEMTHQRRWVTCFEQTFKRKSDNTFWTILWERGSTECQDGSEPDFEMYESVPVEKTIIVYVYKEKE